MLSTAYDKSLATKLLLLSVTIFSLFLLPSANAGIIHGDVDINPGETTFKYLFLFDESEEYTSFSFEKPRDSQVIYARDESGNSLRYRVAGDFLIFSPETTRSKTFDIRFSSVSTSNSVFDKGSFSAYVNFNFPVSQLNYNIDYQSVNRDVEEAIPRSYLLNGGKLSWTIDNPAEDTYFLVNFRADNIETNNLANLSQTYMYLGVGILVVLVIILIVFLLGKKKIVFVGEKEETTKLKEIETKPEEEVDESKEEEIEETFEEIVEKYLTENEKEIVEVIRKNEGISQYDILNFLPTLTKSNLSKIITKLHNKKYLNRIRVGKVNKIHLGEKLSKKKDKE